MKKYGFLFGAGAELAYNLPSGGQFALNIFRQDTTEPKKLFLDMRTEVDSTTTYANDWLPKNYRDKNIHVFGKSVFENIISSTVEHNRDKVIEKVNSFDQTALTVVKEMNVDVEGAFCDILGREVSNIKLSQDVAYNDTFKRGNKLFESNYFSSLLLVYKKTNDEKIKSVLGRSIVSIMQLQLGALSEDLTRTINDNLFSKKDDEIDLFDDFGELIRINYMSAGVKGLELLFEEWDYDLNKPIGVILLFTQKMLENLYASVLDYKSLIDTNWHYLYCPRDDWAKFCKISIFLLTVQSYISKIGEQAKKDNPNGYYNILRKAMDDSKIEVSAVATTNYNNFIEEILGRDITYLNGSTSIWYDPYLNKVGKKEELDDEEHHIIVPLLFTQSGTKPMTAIGMSEKYVDLYRSWKESDAIVVVGFGFGIDDEHINGILRTLVNDDGKSLIIITVGTDEKALERQKARMLKIHDINKIRVIVVDKNGKKDGKSWIEYL